MSPPIPLPFTWDGESFTPAGRYWAKKADELFVVGKNYKLVEYAAASTASRNHYFAAISEAHANLPDELLERFPSPEHLRKHALIKAGYCNVRTIACASGTEAVRAARIVSELDPYALVVPRDAVITVYTAQSQSNRAMGKETFQKSKDATLDVIARLIGTSAAALSKRGEEAA